MTDPKPPTAAKKKPCRKPKATAATATPHPPVESPAANPLDCLVADPAHPQGSSESTAEPTPATSATLAAAPLAKLTRFDKINVVQINRSQLKNAEYNPRKISPSAVIDLRRSLQSHGLVEPLIWNIRTGNLVGGHQRLSQLDLLESTPNYSIHVNQINIDERQERALNIVLNNQSLQGEYDVPVLIDMFRQDTFDLDLSGFKPIDLELMAFDAGLDTDLINSLFTSSAVEEIRESTSEIDAILDQSDELKRRSSDTQNRAANSSQAATRKQSQDEDDGTESDSENAHGRYPEAATPVESAPNLHTANGQPLTPEHFRAAKKAGEESLKPQRESAYYLTLCFPSNAVKFAFCNAIGISESAAHADGGIVAELAGIKLPSVVAESIKIEDSANT